MCGGVRVVRTEGRLLLSTALLSASRSFSSVGLEGCDIGRPFVQRRGGGGGGDVHE